MSNAEYKRLALSSEVHEQISFIFLESIAPLLMSTQRTQRLFKWLQAVMKGEYSVFDTLWASDPCDVALCRVVHSRVMEQIRMRGKFDERCANWCRLSTILSLMLLRHDNTSTFRKFLPMLKNFSMAVLLGEEDTLVLYALMSTETKHTYVGMTGVNGPRPPMKRLEEHYQRAKSPFGCDRVYAKLYQTMHDVGAHKFCIIPCDFGVNGVSDLDRLETVMIRKFIPSMNTAKIPIKNRRRRARPNPHVRRMSKDITDMRPQTPSVDSDAQNKIPHYTITVVKNNESTLVCRQKRKSKSKNIFKKILNIVTDTFHTNLFKAFQILYKRSLRKDVIVEQSTGCVHLTQWTQLLKRFGNSMIKVLWVEEFVPTVTMSLTQFVRYAKRFGVLRYRIQITRLVENNVYNSLPYRELLNAVSHQTSRSRQDIFENLPPRELIKLWTLIPKLPLQSQRAEAEDILLKGMRRVKINPRPESVIKFPYRDDVVLTKGRAIPDALIDLMSVSNEYKKTLKGEVRVTACRRQNMADRLINCRKQAKSYSETPPRCTCERLAQTFGLDATARKKFEVNGHLAIRATELPASVDPLFKGNLKNIPKTEFSAFRKEITCAVEEWVRRFTPIFQDDPHRTSPIDVGTKFVKIYEFGQPHTGEHLLATVTLERFQRWHFEYDKVRIKNPTLYTECHGTNFTADVVKMVRTHCKSMTKHHWVHHPSLYKKLQEIFGTRVEYFSSPLNFNLCHDAYFSEHSIDRLFGSKGNSWKAKWHTSGVANPEFTIPDMRKTFAYAKKHAKLYKGNAFLVTIPLWESQAKEEYLHFLKDTCVHPVLTFRKGEYGFHGPFETTRQYLFNRPPQRMAQFDVGVFLVRQTGLSEHETNAIHDLRYELTTGPLMMTPESNDDMCSSLQNIECDNTIDEDPIPVCDVDKICLRTWKIYKAYKSDVENTSMTLQVICDRFKINIDELIDMGMEKMKRPLHSPPPSSEFVLDGERLTKFEKTLKNIYKYATVFPIDKNAACALYTCHMYAHEAAEKTFPKDPHYERHIEDNEAILKRWRRTHVHNKWQKFGRFAKWKLPYAYALPKNKDLNKTRPIVSYATHPMRVMLRRASRALKRLLDDKHVKDLHFNMNKTGDFVSRITQIENQLKSNGFDKVMVVAGDIKNMYTELPHDFIVEAVQWLFDTVTPKYRNKKHISVPLRGRHGTEIGRSHHTQRFATFTLDELMEIVKFDLDNAIFTLGEITLKQNVGIPMGSPMSPVLATIMCSYCEAKFKETMRQKYGDTNANSVHGIRYVDDALYLAGYDSKSAFDKSIAKSLVQEWIDKAYHKNLVLEVDPERNFVHMLESVINTTTDTLQMTFWHKNAESIRYQNKQKLLKYQHFHSFASYSVKRGVLISTLMRMRVASSNDDCMLLAVPTFVKELYLLDYPLSIVKSAVQAVARKRDSQFWRGVVTPLVTDIWKTLKGTNTPE